MKRKERKSPRPSPRGEATGRRVSGNGRAKLGKQRSAPTGNQRSLIAKRREKANEVGREELIEDCPNTRGLAQLSGTGSRRVPVPAKGENYCSSGFEIRLHGIGDLQSQIIHSKRVLRI